MPEPESPLPLPTDQPWQLTLARSPSAVSPQGRVVALQWRDAALLAWLAIEGPTARARLASLLWPDSSVESARNSLRQRLFQLRKQTGADLVGGSTVMALVESVVHDLDEADGVLDGTVTEVGGEFAVWLDRVRARRIERVRESLQELSDMAERAGDWSDALVHANELLALQPLSEEAHRRVMRLHYLAGDTAAALLAFDACERVLKDEVGTAPDVQTLGLLRTIERARDGARQLAPSTPIRVPTPPLAVFAPSRIAPASVLRPPRLVGREHEWQQLSEAWATRRVALVTGEPGLGKTRLVSDFAAAASAVLVVQARPGDERVVYGTLSRALHRIPLSALAGVAPALRRELARLLPALEDTGRPTTGPAADDAGRTRFLNGVAAALADEALGLQGIVLDDLHFADEASVDLLRHAMGQVPLRWIVASRPAEGTTAAMAMLEALREDAEAVVLPLASLTLPQVVEFVASLDLPGWKPDEAAPELLRRTGGNPLFLLETVKAMLVNGSDVAASMPLARGAPVSTLIGRRIGRLSHAAVNLARCAALAAPDFSIELAAQVLGVRTLDLADPWAELEAAHVLCGDGAFAHDLIHEAAVASVPAPVARRLHGEIAAYLEMHGGEAARRAHHWQQAWRWPHAARAWLEAARCALDAGRDGEYCQLLDRAARAFDEAGDPAARFDALRRRAEMLVRKDLDADAQRAVGQLADAAVDDVQRLDAVAARLELANHRVEIGEVLDLAPQAVEAARAQGRHDLQIRFVIAWAGALLEQRRLPQAIDLLTQHRSTAEALADEELRHEFDATIALALMFDGRLRDAAQRNDVCIELARRLSRPDMLWEDLGRAAGILGLQGRSQQAIGLLRQVRAMAAEAGAADQMRLLQTDMVLAHRLRDVGEYAQALPMLEQQLAAFVERGMVNDIVITEHRLAWLFMLLGQPARAKALLEERPSLAAGQAMFRQVMRCELDWHFGRASVSAVRDALDMLPDRDDVFHRVGSLLAARLIDADEGEAMAASVAHWAIRQERMGLAMSAHARAASRAADQEAYRRALPHIEAALALETDFQSETFYVAELWWASARVFIGLKQDDAARGVLRRGREWVNATARDRVPPAFRDSFLQRNHVNRELLALAGRLG